VDARLTQRHNARKREHVQIGDRYLDGCKADCNDVGARGTRAWMLRDAPADPASSSSAYDGVSLCVGDWQSIPVGCRSPDTWSESNTAQDSNGVEEVMGGEFASIAHCN
jgi:hypothetical protein